ncbi:CPBP family intramembrane glutamic endopeptidase [Paenibacillus sanguinis]|uniref:CPBP family intramembrane glutamic endopeptidase n=1 Tax=Paenibacillus sanguinis TaxID=225906 RepID=UPI00036580BA|nr:type II CAAX endopeptidase family protein [Paenibacillus sanguinis]
MKQAFAITGKMVLTVLIFIVLVVMGEILLIISGGQTGWSGQLVTNIAMMGAPLIMYAIFERRHRWGLGLLQPRAAVNAGLGMLTGVGLITVSFAAIWALGGLQVTSVHGDAATWRLVGIQFVVFTFVAISEELLCRGYLQGLIKYHYGLRAAVWIPSLLFALLHLGNPGILATPLPLLNIFLVGIFFAMTREITGGLWFPTGFHLTWNFVQGNVFGLAVSGTEGGSLMTSEVQGHPVISGGSFGAEGSLLTTIILLLACLLVLRIHRRLDRLPRMGR